MMSSIAVARLSVEPERTVVLDYIIHGPLDNRACRDATHASPYLTSSPHEIVMQN